MLFLPADQSKQLIASKSTLECLAKECLGSPSNNNNNNNEQESQHLIILGKQQQSASTTKNAPMEAEETPSDMSMLNAY